MMLNIEVLKRKQLKLSNLITENFWETHLLWKKGLYARYIEKGGRGSGKSSYIAVELVRSLIDDPVNIVVFRKVAETLRKSVYEQIKWAISYLGVEDYFILKQSPLEIIYKERGNKFIFLGVDDPQKIKSIKQADFPIAYFWFEELAEFKTEEEVETVIKSILRGKLKPVIEDGKEKIIKYKGFFSYNPPKTKTHWVNKKYGFSGVEGNTFVHHSTYLANPYISKEFIEDAEITKAKDEIMYRHEFLGEAVGVGIIPFPKLTIRKISKKEIEALDTFRAGVDWGYATDPLAYVRWGLDKKRRRIYATDEFYGVKRSNEQLANYIKKKGYEEIIVCDSAEPKSIAEMREYEIRAVAAKKGKGSVEYGEKWLGECEIIIDPQLTPNTAREFEIADYETDREGNLIPRLKDKDNHTIDATRYAFERDMKKGKFIY